MWRDWEKNCDTILADLANRQAEMVRAMQQPSYWLDAGKMAPEAMLPQVPGVSPGMVMTAARYGALTIRRSEDLG